MRKARKEYEEQTLDLVPIMNLVTILIPFLLMSAQFVTLAVIDSTLPAIQQESNEPPKEEEEEPLGLSILITDEGFTLTGKGLDAELPKDDEVNGPNVVCLEAGCPTAESYDYDTLRKKLVQVKDRWNDEENAILVPGSKVSYETVVLTMDAAREDPEDVVDESTQKKRELFPFVVIAAGVN